MSLKNFLTKYEFEPRLIKRQESSYKEINDLLVKSNRYLKDFTNSKATLTLDAQFSFCYGAALTLCTAIVRSEGLRASGGAHHMINLRLIIFIMGDEKKKLSDYFNQCRRTRNIIEYGSNDVATEEEVEELYQAVGEFAKEAREWLYANHPNLMGYEGE